MDEDTTSQDSGAKIAHSPDPTGVPGGAPPVEPMTGSLMLRLFAVPAGVVAVIVGASVLVVVMFGAITKESDRSISQLIDSMAATSGEKSFGGMLFPKEKEMWQAGPELVRRLREKEKEPELKTPEARAAVAERLTKLIEPMAEGTGELSEQGRQRLSLLVAALAALEQPASIPLLQSLLKSEAPSSQTGGRAASSGSSAGRQATAATGIRIAALKAMADMGDTPGIRETLPDLIECVTDPDPVVAMVACVAVSRIAPANHEGAIQALRHAYVSDDRDTRWNAALALARMGSPAGRGLLLDMLDRDYWENKVRTTGTTSQGYELPPATINRYMIAAIDAAVHLDEADIWEAIKDTTSDVAPDVADRARRAVADRDASPKSPS
jgi:HEAT repeat protein